MTEEEQKDLFSVFGKLESSEGINKQGVGLGLSISKALAVELGGDIFVKSIKDVGTTFELVVRDQPE